MWIVSIGAKPNPAHLLNLRWLICRLGTSAVKFNAGYVTVAFKQREGDSVWQLKVGGQND
jgi:hypothetical protein